MREIKFRAKPNMAYFFESDNVPTFDGFVFGTPDTRMLNVPGADKWRKEHKMVDQPSIVAMTRDGWPCSVVVIEDTIGEFTGLYDKNGKEIYEGDVVKSNCNFHGLVRWHKNGYFYIDENPDKVIESDFTPLGEMLKFASFEVIGNAYDNPELLK